MLSFLSPYNLLTVFFYSLLLTLFCDQALTEKMNEKISNQEMELTSLQEKVDSIVAAMNDMSKTLSSLEAKINEDKSKNYQPFLTGRKTKSM